MNRNVLKILLIIASNLMLSKLKNKITMDISYSLLFKLYISYLYIRNILHHYKSH